jgi:hypothetical protein
VGEDQSREMFRERSSSRNVMKSDFQLHTCCSLGVLTLALASLLQVNLATCWGNQVSFAGVAPSFKWHVSYQAHIVQFSVGKISWMAIV